MIQMNDDKKELFDLIKENEPTKKLKKIGNYKKGEKVGFETLITKLKEKCYIVTIDSVYLRDKNGNTYG